MESKSSNFVLIILLTLTLIFSAANVVADEVEQAEENNQYLIEIELAGEGIVELEPEQEYYEAGDVVVLEAISEPGWQFLEWGGDLSGSEPLKELTVTEDLVIGAEFLELVEDEYVVEIYVLDGGDVILDPDQNSFNEGDEVTIEAQAETGWEFTGWSGDLDGDENPVTITIDENKLLHPGFVEAETTEEVEDEEQEDEGREDYYDLDTEVEGRGIIELNPDENKYESGTEIEVRAIPEEGWQFSNWRGELISEEITEELVIEEDSIIRAEFVELIDFNRDGLRGSGTLMDPFRIETFEDLELIGQDEYSLSAHYELESNIDASKTQNSDYNEGAGWQAIGDLDEPFSGSFSGEGYQITNLKINQAESDNLGLFGVTDEAVISDLFLSDLKLNGNRYLGGLVGRNIESEITRVSITGEITGEYYVGQLIGYNFGGSVEQAYATGDVNANMVVGGLVGDNNGMIDNSFATTKVEGVEMVGGLVGINGEGDISPYKGLIRNSYAAGEVTGDFRTGGLVGANNWVGTIEDSYWDVEVSGLEQSDGGQGLTTPEMGEQESYDNWSFFMIWQLDNDYPILRWLD